MTRPEVCTHLIDEQVRQWRQGDVALDAGLEFIHLADLSRPHSPASIEIAIAIAIDESRIEGTEVIANGVEGVCSAYSDVRYSSIQQGTSIHRSRASCIVR